jgi:phosphoserine phosphatase
VKQRINRYLQSRLSSNELRDRLVNHRDRHRIAVFDLDGTLHEGLCYRLWSGLSNVDLSLWLGVLLLTEPVRYFSYARRLLAFKMRWHRIGPAQNSTSREFDSTPFEIISFVEEVLKDLPYSYIERAAFGISKLHFPDAPFCVESIASSSHSCAIVSRAFLPVLEAYSRQLLPAQTSRFYTYGNVLTVEDGLVRSLDPDRRILSGADKRKIVQNLLAPWRGRGRAIICGNGREDLAMFEIADEILGSEQVLKIAVKPTSEILMDKADVVAFSWKGLKQVLSPSRNQEPVLQLTK